MEEVSRTRFPVLQSCPFQLGGRFRQASRVALETLHNGVIGHDLFMETTGWKLFILLLFMLLRRPRGHAKVGKDELGRRFESSLQECGLICSVRDTKLAHKKGTRHTRGWIPLNAGQLQLARKSNWGRARRCLTGAPLAPGTEETFQVLQARRPQIAVRELPEEVRAFEPDSPMVMDKIFLKCSVGRYRHHGVAV